MQARTLTTLRDSRKTQFRALSGAGFHPGSDSSLQNHLRSDTLDQWLAGLPKMPTAPFKTTDNQTLKTRMWKQRRWNRLCQRIQEIAEDGNRPMVFN